MGECQIFDILEPPRSRRTVPVSWRDDLGWYLPGIINLERQDNWTLLDAFGEDIELLYWTKYPAPNIVINS